MKKLVFLFLILCGFMPARANDTAGYVLPTGGVVFQKQDGIKMRTEALYIRPGQIEVNYLFENTTDNPITTAVCFPLPPISAVLDYYTDYLDATHQFRFKLWVNGKEQLYQTQFSLQQHGRPVPSFASKIWKYPEESLDEATFHQRFLALSPAERQTLIDGKYIYWGYMLVLNKQTGESGEQEGWLMSDRHDTLWEKQITYSWEQTFPPHKTITVRHTYTPSYKTINTGAPFSKCIEGNSPAYQLFSAPAAQGEKRLAAQNYLEYILTTAQNWQGPIGHFNLLIESPLKSVGCFDGGPFYAKQFYAINRPNYTPERDLSVDFLDNKSVLGYQPKYAPVLYRVNGPAKLRSTPHGKTLGKLENNTYIWGWPGKKQGKWIPVLQNQFSGYAHQKNLIQVF